MVYLGQASRKVVVGIRLNEWEETESQDLLNSHAKPHSKGGSVRRTVNVRAFYWKRNNHTKKNWLPFG